MQNSNSSFCADLVSVIIPTYNREYSLTRSIESVLSQTYKKWELIIIDDCSTDNTVNIVEKFRAKDKRINFFKLEKNSGACVARNLGIKKAKGEFIAFLDSDDEYLPEKLKKQVEFFGNSKDPNLGVLSCGRVDYRDGVEYRKTLPEKKNDYYTSLLSKERRIGAGTPFLMVKASILKENKIFFDPEMPAMQDWDFLIRICKNFSFDFVPEYLVRVNHHSGERVFNSKNAVKALFLQHEKYKDWFAKEPEAYRDFLKNSATLIAHHCSIEEGKKLIDSGLQSISYKMKVELIFFKGILSCFHNKYFKLFYMKFLLR